MRYDNFRRNYHRHTQYAGGCGCSSKGAATTHTVGVSRGCFIRSCVGDHFMLTPPVLNGAILSRISDCECLESAMGAFHDVTNSYISPHCYATHGTFHSPKPTDFILETTVATSCVGKELSFPKSFLLSSTAIVSVLLNFY